MTLVSHKRAVGENKTYNLFANRFLAIATMHDKEKVIAPLLEETIQVECQVPLINTDELGTFSGEIERKHSPIETARLKCEIALQKTRYDLAVASEGSFGAHPTYPFVSADDEIILLVDKKNDLEIWGRTLSTETNFAGKAVKDFQEAQEFANKIGFPEHALIIRDQQESTIVLHKGINSFDMLEKLLSEQLSNETSVWLETDMRAMNNPSRMKIIKEATFNLIKKLQSHCPDCYFPGYWIKKAIPGLPCVQCSLPTRSTLSYEYGCINCDHTSKRTYPNNKKVEDPMYCDFCNP